MNKMIRIQVPKFPCADHLNGERFNKIKKWVYMEKKEYKHQKGKTTLTHCFLDGGAIAIPEHEYPNFFNLYVQCLESGERVFIHEQRSDPWFPFYIDMDLLLHEKITDEELLDLIDSVGQNIMLWVKKAQRKNAYFIVTKPEFTKKEDKFKIGVHMHFPYLPVTGELATELIMYLVERMGKEPSYFVEEWSKVLDPLVYTTDSGHVRGLRMLGSRKAEPCKTCKGTEAKNFCDVCEKTGKVDLGRPYWPFACFAETKKQAKKLSQMDLARFVRECSVQIQPHIEKPTFNAMFRRPYGWKKPKGIVRIKNNKKRKQPSNIEAEEEGDWKALDPTTDTYKTFEKYFTKQHKHYVQYAHIFQADNIIDIKVSQDNKCYLVFTSSKKCLNLKPYPNGQLREHNRCTVYFLFRKQGAIQRCFCKCKTTENRINGACSGWVGQHVPLPDEFRDLFEGSDNKRRRCFKRSKQGKVIAVDEEELKNVIVEEILDCFAIYKTDVGPLLKEKNTLPMGGIKPEPDNARITYKEWLERKKSQAKK